MGAVSKRVICADVELAGVVQSEIDKAGLGEEFEVQSHPWAPPGFVIVEGEALEPDAGWLHLAITPGAERDGVRGADERVVHPGRP